MHPARDARLVERDPLPDARVPVPRAAPGGPPPRRRRLTTAAGAPRGSWRAHRAPGWAGYAGRVAAARARAGAGLGSRAPDANIRS